MQEQLPSIELPQTDSLINRVYKFDAQHAVISLLQTAIGASEMLLAQHAKIIVELLENGQHKLYSCHIQLAGELVGSINPQGRAQVLCNPYVNTDYLDHVSRKDLINRDYTGDYQKCTSTSWRVPLVDATNMLQNIDTQKTRIEQGLERLLYQKAGKHTWLWSNNGGHSCITWCEEKLAIAHVGKGVKPVDKLKAVPELHAQQYCSLL